MFCHKKQQSHMQFMSLTSHISVHLKNDKIYLVRILIIVIELLPIRNKSFIWETH